MLLQVVAVEVEIHPKEDRRKPGEPKRIVAGKAKMRLRDHPTPPPFQKKKQNKTSGDRRSSGNDDPPEITSPPPPTRGPLFFITQSCHKPATATRNGQPQFRVDNEPVNPRGGQVGNRQRAAKLGRSLLQKVGIEPENKTRRQHRHRKGT